LIVGFGVTRGFQIIAIVESFLAVILERLIVFLSDDALIAIVVLFPLRV
jgi:hypothetical protein